MSVFGLAGTQRDDMKPAITDDDFIAGLFAALADKGRETIPIQEERFDQAVQKVFINLRRLAKQKGYLVHFVVRLHPIHSDSLTVRDSLASAAKDGIISFDNPSYQTARIKIKRADARKFLKRLPGGPELYEKLAEKFEHEYLPS